jgi:uncharacterized protein (TIGR02246 family)
MADANAEDIASELAAGLAAAWNQHDMHAFASLFHDDAAFVNVAGRYLRSRGEIEQVHAAAHAGPFKNSALTARAEDARSQGPDLIIAHVRSELQGDDRVPGQVRRTLMTLVIERRGGQWKIIAAHNTNIAAPPG